MKLGTMGFVPRARSGMEALDLGLSLLQAHWSKVAAVWSLEVGLVLVLLLPFSWRSPLWILLGIWWLKPWLDRGVLFVLSRAVFGQPASLWDFLQEWRSVHRRGLLAGLIWRRFSPVRSYVLPVFQLEGLDGAAYRARARVLTRQGGGAALLLACSGWFFTFLTFIGFLALLQAMMPPGLHVRVWDGFQAMPTGFQWFLLALGILALTLTEPFFVAAGFSLYLNRRTQLEGWDLELEFRRLASRLAMLLLFLICALPLGAKGPKAGPDAKPAGQVEVVAQAPPPPPPTDGPLRPEAEARTRVLRILKEDPAFRHTQEVRTLRYEPTGREPKWLRAILDALFGKRETKRATEKHLPKALWGAIAFVGEVILVGGLLALVLWLVYRFHHRFGGFTVREEAWEAPEAVAGLDIRPDSLPPDVPAAARNLFLRGEARAALALLYRGALAELVHRRGMEIPASATEGDCLRAAQGRLEEGSASIFRALTTTWQRLAYKDEIPVREAFEDLCTAWPVAFGDRP